MLKHNKYQSLLYSKNTYNCRSIWDGGQDTHQCLFLSNIQPPCIYEINYLF